jgi:uncharacterized protein (PEP-CTERM system associated)
VSRLELRSIDAPAAVCRRLLKHGVPVVALAFSGVACAERWTLDASVAAQVTATDNSGIEARNRRESDVLVELTPRIGIRGEGARLRVGGSLALGGVHYVEGTQDSRLLPAADLVATLEAIERRLFVEAAAIVTQTRENPFAPRPEGASTFNRLETRQGRVSPYLQGRFATDIRYLIRSDNAWTTTSEVVTAEGDSYVGRHLVEIDRAPRRVGWGAQVERTNSRFEQAAQRRLRQDVARLRLDYAFTAQLAAGVRAGYEQNNFVLDGRGDGSIYGVNVTWRPTERTDLTGFWEDRFFGSGWRLSFSHRMPRLAWNALLSRDLGSAPQSLFTLPATDNVAGLLDAAFTTRFPDPVERARIVQDLIVRQGLPSALGAPLAIYAQRISLINSRSASVVLLGVRNSLGLTGFYLRTEDLSGTTFTGVGTAFANNTQRGATVTFSHQLSTVTSLNATTGWTRTRALGLVDPEQADQHTLRMQVSRQLAPRTSAFVGARYQLFNSNRVDDARETAVFAGIGHRF